MATSTKYKTSYKTFSSLDTRIRNFYVNLLVGILILQE